jgi:hypothetical protein
MAGFYQPDIACRDASHCQAVVYGVSLLSVRFIPSSRGGILRRLRSVRRRLASGVLSLLGVVWLNMAVQPCLMAAEPLLPEQHHESGCPHCPPMERHCGDQDSGGCTYFDAIDFDGRPAPVPNLDDIKLTVAAPAPIAPGPLSRADHRLKGPDEFPPPPTGPPLFVRNCSFLK